MYGLLTMCITMVQINAEVQFNMCSFINLSKMHLTERFYVFLDTSKFLVIVSRGHLSLSNSNTSTDRLEQAKSSRLGIMKWV